MVEFHMALEKEVNATYDADLEAYSTSTSKPRSVHEYYEAMNNALNSLLPFANAVAQQFNMSVMILIVGPMNDGKIMVRR